METLSITEKNLKFLSLGSEPISIPKEFHFMRKYFKTKDQQAFFNYYFVFRDERNFVNHTGVKITPPSACKLKGKFEWLMQEYLTAKNNMDLDRLAKLKKRRIKLLKRFY